MPSDGATDFESSNSTGASSLRARLRRLMPRVADRAKALRNRLRGAEDGTEIIDREYVEEGARRVTSADLDTVVRQAEAIEERFRGEGPLARLLEDGRLLLALIRDARKGRYRQVPVWTLSAAGFALLYVLNPLDLVPDALPVLGLLDDAAVVSACLALIEQDLHAYRTWRRAHGEKRGPEAEDGSPER